MKLSRRKIFGVAVGGAIAGPRMAREAAEASWLPLTPYGDRAMSLKDAAPGLSVDALAKYKRIAAGDIRDEDRDYPTNGPVDPYEGLKSVSRAAARYMQNERYERQWRERTIKRALDVLDNYDKTGILRSFF